MNSAKIVVLLVVFIIVMLSISLIIYVPSNMMYSPYNPGLSGLSKFRELYAPQILFGGDSLEGFDTVVLLLANGAGNFSRYIEFVRGGGRLIILDEGGFSNPLLSSLGLRVRVLNMCILDEVFKFGDRGYVRANLTIGNYSVGLSRPCVIDIVGGVGEVLAYSSVFSYVDVDGDGNYTVGEPIGDQPIIVRFGYGSGDIILVGDGDFICNLFLEKGINIGFLDEYVSGRVALDLRYTSYSQIDVVKKRLDDLGALGGGVVFGVILLFLMAVGVVIYGELEKV